MYDFFLVDLSFNFKFFTSYLNLLDMDSVKENNTLRMSNLDPLFAPFPQLSRYIFPGSSLVFQ